MKTCKFEIEGKRTGVKLTAERLPCWPFRYKVTFADGVGKVGTYSEKRLWELFRLVQPVCSCSYWETHFRCVPQRYCAPCDDGPQPGQEFIHKRSGAFGHITRVISTGAGMRYCTSHDGPHTYTHAELLRDYTPVLSVQVFDGND